MGVWSRLYWDTPEHSQDKKETLQILRIEKQTTKTVTRATYLILVPKINETLSSSGTKSHGTPLILAALVTKV